MARARPTLVQAVDGVELRRKPPTLRSWRCIQPSAAETTAGVSFVGKMTPIPRAAAVV